MARRQMGYTVAEGKERFAALVEEAAHKHGLSHPDGSADVYALAELAKFESPATIRNAITDKGRGMGIGALMKLAALSDRPLSEWAASVGKTVPDLSGGSAPVDTNALHPITRQIAQIVEEQAPTDADKAWARDMLLLQLRGPRERAAQTDDEDDEDSE